MKPRQKPTAQDREAALVRRTISLPKDVDEMADEMRQRERRNRSSYIISLIIRDHAKELPEIKQTNEEAA